MRVPGRLDLTKQEGTQLSVAPMARKSMRTAFYRSSNKQVRRDRQWKRRTELGEVAETLEGKQGGRNVCGEVGGG